MTRAQAKRNVDRSCGGRPLRLEMLEDRCLLSFLPALNFPAGTTPRSVAVGDFNGDGTPDLAVANYGLASGSTASVLLGNGDGTFQAPQSYAADGNPISVAVGDFNGDGTPDLAVTNYFSSTVSIFLGNGDGTFQAKTDYTTGLQPRSVAVGDFAGNGILDLATANYGSKSMSVFLGNGDGTFQAKQDYPMQGSQSIGPWSVAVADVNGDGSPDLVVASESYNANGTVSVLLGNGDGTFSPAIYFGAGKDPHGVAAGDLRGNGHQDVVTADYQGNSVSVLLGYGNGSFQTAVNYAVGSYPEAVTVADVNGDGIPDIIAANSLGGSSVSVLLGQGDGTFQPALTYAVGSHPYSVAAADLNGDGLVDLVTANNAGNSVSVLLNDGNWPAAPPDGSPATGPGVAPTPGTGMVHLATREAVLEGIWPAGSRPAPLRLENVSSPEQGINQPRTSNPMAAPSAAFHLGRGDALLRDTNRVDALSLEDLFHEPVD